MSITRTFFRPVLAVLLMQMATSPVYAAPLTEQIIAQFATTWQPLTTRLVAVDAEFDPLNVAGLNLQLQQMAQSDGPNSARDAAVAKDGYSDFETWCQTATQIIAAAQWAKDPLDASDVDNAIMAINGNQSHSAEEKLQSIADVKSAFEMALKQKPDQSDIDVTKRLLPLIEPIVWPKL